MKKRLKTMVIVLLVIVIAGLAAALFFIPRLMIGPMINIHVTYGQIFDPEDHGLTAQDLSLTSSDGLVLEAYEVPHEQPRGVVIFMTGIHNPSVTAFYGHAKMLHDEGFASVLLEVRAHGRSEGRRIGLGYHEVKDVEAAVRHIKEQPLYRDLPIAVFGLSMGGAVAVNAAAHIEDVDLLIALSAYSSFTDAFLDNMRNMGVPRFLLGLQKPFIDQYLRSQYGKDLMSLTPVESIALLGDKPALLMHSTGDSQVPFESFKRLTARVPRHVQTWTVEGDNHFILPDDGFWRPYDHEEYKTVILDFLNRHIGRLVPGSIAS